MIDRILNWIMDYFLVILGLGAIFLLVFISVSPHAHVRNDCLENISIKFCEGKGETFHKLNQNLYGKPIYFVCLKERRIAEYKLLHEEYLMCKEQAKKVEGWW